MDKEQEKVIYKEKILPVMDKYRKAHPDSGYDMYFTAVVAELRKSNVPLSNNLVNMMLDKMARDSMPKGTWDYISGRISDGNIIKAVYNWTHSDANDTPLEAEIKRRAELMYDASTTEKTIASIGTGTTDILATAPIVVLCPKSAVYGYLTQGGYDIVNNKILLPESQEERDTSARSAIGTYNAREQRTNSKLIPGWMLSQNGIASYTTASDKKLESARDWAKKNANWWHDEYDKLCREHKESALVNGKTFSKLECLVKSNQYDLFRGECQKELTNRFLAKRAEEEARQRAEAESENTDILDNVSDALATGKDALQDMIPSDPWGALLNGLGFNGLGNVGKHLGITLATLPDMIFGAFTGRTKSLGMNKETLVPLASLAAGHFVSNPLLKAALMGYGGLNLINKVGNEAIARQSQTNAEAQKNANVRYKQYADEALNPRITNVHIEGNQLLADIDKVPCAIMLPDTTVSAYKSGALPLNTLANAVLEKSDLMAQQTQQASLAYSNMQEQEQSRGIR